MSTGKMLASSRLVCIFFLCGCVADDFNNFAKGFTPITPKQAADMASDQHTPDERREGITLLANSAFGGGPPYVAMYRDYISAEIDALVRAAAIKALARYAEVSDAEIILPWLRLEGSKSLQGRREAALALQRIHNPLVVRDLLSSLGNEKEHESVRSASAIALGHYPEDRVFRGLISSLDANELSINLAAAESLHMLSGQVFGINRYEWFEWYTDTRKRGGDPFQGMSLYQYPTFQYEPQWWDRYVFWEHGRHEMPSVPVGLEDPTRRATYDDDATATQ